MTRPSSTALALVRVLAVGVLAGLACGCRVYDPARLEQRGGGRTPPARPDIEDTSSEDVYAFGMRHVIMAQGENWAQYGYDVDGFVTTGTNRVAECNPPSGSLPNLDGETGVDNVFGDDFFPLVALTTPDLEQSSRDAQEMGQGLPIVRMVGWNGQADDPRVDIQVMQAVFGMPGGDETTPPAPPADPSTSRPMWDGRDWFWVRDDAFLMGDVARPLIRDDNAYVAGNVIVARLPSRVDIIFPADEYGVLVRLTDAVVTGTINADRTEIENVIVSGRWSINDLLFTAANVGICPGTTNYDLLVRQLDMIADVRSDPGTGGDGVTCDAISIGVGFMHGTRLRVAGTAPGPDLRNLCTDPLPDGGPGGDGGTMLDGGMSALDGGVRDAGMDAGALDAGIDAGALDSGMDDAGSEDAGGGADA